MKKHVILMAALLLALLSAIPALAEAADPALSDWTVMFYFCGSDLESGHSYASYNLAEISYCLTYDTVKSARTGAPDVAPDTEAVNVVIQTGGSKEWHAQELGMNVRRDALQRWHFRPARNTLQTTIQKLQETDDLSSRELLKAFAESIHENAAMELAQELPLASMADPGTLADFIRWSAETYPAKKYCLVLWDHGTGAKNGLLIDELFGGDTMRLDELKTALADSGVHFEAVLFDACLMANLETACAIKDSADWMIASEELVAGKGTAMYSWLSQLYITPQWDGMRLGRWVCEMTQEKYAQEVSGQAEDTLTWSVIDLSKIDRLAAAFDDFFASCDYVYVNNPYYTVAICEILNDAFEFGLGDANMIDLARIPYHTYSVFGMEEGQYTELLDALIDAVAYNTHGPNRVSAGGLSFCYAARATPAELDAYANVCPSAHYLALLDAINPHWEAPEWVFKKAEKLPEIVDMPSYQIRVEKGFEANGTPNIAILDGYPCLWNVRVYVSRLNSATGNIVRLGRTDAGYALDADTQRISYSLKGLVNWPTLEDVHCSAELVSEDYLGSRLYNIPIMINGDTYLLRCGSKEDGQPVVYGFWEGYNSDSGVFSRNVVPLARMAGQEYHLLYPIDGTEGSGTRYESSEPMTMYRSLEISSKPLEPGTYYLDYVVEDIFMRKLPVGRVEIGWDGQKLTVQDGTWQGEMTLTVGDQ